MLTTLISAGILLAFALVIFCLIKWWDVRNIGVTPVPLFTFIAILFTSGLDVGLIMFPLAWDFPLYADTAAEPAYGFTNPLLGLPDLGVLLPDQLLFLRHRAAGEVL